MFAFPKSKRLLDRKDFKPAMDSGEKVVCPEMVVLMKESTASATLNGTPQKSTEPRLGLVVSKKVGNSVVRNRVKRVLRESFRHFTGSATPLGNHDIVVIARAKAAEVSNEVLTQAFERCLSRLAGRKRK